MDASFFRAVLVAVAALAGLGGAQPSVVAAQEALPAGIADEHRVSVSGISSGAYMAMQFHVAFSEGVMGAGIVAGGPYDCAQGLLTNALTVCMATTLDEPDAEELRNYAAVRAGEGRIDPLAGLAGDRVYLFSGQNDETVEPVVVEAARAFYELAGVAPGDLVMESGIAAGHAFLTEDFGESCEASDSPFINDCDYDQAGAILTQIYGPLAPKAATPSGQLLEFDQSLYLSDPERFSLNEIGYLYLPANCSEAAPCRLHVAFHGCRQTTDDIDELFVTRAGFNAWADTNRIAVLYPQAWAGPGNPKGCWDWWGYSGADYALKTGKQMVAVRQMIDLLTGKGYRYCQRYADANYNHWIADRAQVCDWVFLCAKGSGDRLGWAYGSSVVYEQPRGSFSLTPCE